MYRSSRIIFAVYATDRVPLKQEKTVYPTTMLTFLGLELDTNDMEIRLLMEKLQKIREKLSLYKQRKKIT